MANNVLTHPVAALGSAYGVATLADASLPSGTTGELILKGIVYLIGALPGILSLVDRRKKKRSK